MKHRFVLVSIVLLISGLAYAQERIPVLVVPPDPAQPGITEEMTLAALDIDVKVSGFLADTSMTMTFANPNDRVLSGDLYFPLPEGATVSGYALDINGQMIDGVVVGKEEGRQVFEKIVRQGLDPGLVEYTKGNHFKTRVFPLPAQGKRTIRVRYVSELLPGTDAARYQLPLHYEDAVGTFHLRVEVVKSQIKPEVQSGGLALFEFAQWRDNFVAETTLQDQSLTEDLVIALPDAPERSVAVEANANGNTYFTAAYAPKPPAKTPSAPPARITVLWDASGSREGAGRTAEIALLRDYLATFSGNTVTVDLVLFRNAFEAARPFTVENGACPDLMAALENIEYDGGTQLGVIAPVGDAPVPDFYLLFSDGISNFGRAVPEGFTRPVYAFSADAAAAHAALRALAQGTGGEYFNLSRVEAALVLPQIGQSPFSLLRVEVVEGHVSDVLPAGRATVQGRLLVSGKLLSDSATLVLHFGVGGTETERSSPIVITKADAAEGDLLRPYWAQEQLDVLLANPDANATAITALGRQHGLVTPGSSLIVLDSLDQYVQNEIRPPATLPDMRAQYDELMATKEKEKQAGDEQKVVRLLGLWRERVQWWEKKFERPRKHRKHAADRAGAADGDGLPSGDMETQSFFAAPVAAAEAPAPPPAEAPALAPEPPAVAEAEAEAEAETDLKAALDAPAPEPGIEIKPWDPQTPYIEKLRAASAAERYRVYLVQKMEYGTSPAFYLDCADFFLEQKDESLALRVLSNIAELELENAALLRVLGHRLAQLDRLDLSIQTFEEVLKLRGEEPQSFRDLALVLARRAEAGGADADRIRADFARAIDLLYHVVLNTWDRFDQIELTALIELNRLIPLAKAAGLEEIPVDERLIRPMDLDIRIVLTWDTDLTDMDLWVTEPTGEKAYYGYNLTEIGGLVSRDFTQGYGPEEYLLHRAVRGKYKVEANFYGSSAPELIGAVTLQLDIFTNYGRSDEKRQSITLRLKEKKETFPVGEVTF